MSYHIKQYAYKAAAHSKQTIEVLKRRKCLGDVISTIQENKDVRADHYRCALALYLLSILSQSFNIIIDRGIIAPGHSREAVDDLNDTDFFSNCTLWPL